MRETDSNINEITGANGIKYMTKEELEAGLDYIRQSPNDKGALEMIVRRPVTVSLKR